MSRVNFVEHRGQKILHLDFSNCKSDEVLVVIDRAKAVIAAQPPKSLFVMSDFTGAGFNTQVVDALKGFVNHNKPFVVASAVVGVTGLKQIVFNTVTKFSGRRLHAFNSLDEAKGWLSSQE